MTRGTLVSIERKTIDSNIITGFIFKVSDDLVLLSYVYDFNLDGIMVLRNRDISSRRTTDSDLS